MKQRLLGSLLAATLSVASLAQSSSQSGTISPYSQFGLGVLSDQSQAVGRGMGGTGIALRGGTLVNTLNPASYAAVDSQSMVFDAGLSAQLTNFKEGGTRVNARSANFDYAVALFRVKKHLGVSVGVLPFSDIGYSYSTSSYLNNTIGSITETYRGSGGMHQAFIGAGWNLVKPLSIGFNLAYLWGDYDRGVTTTANSSVNSLSKTYKASVSNYTLTLGLQWQQKLSRTDVLTLGATFGLGHKLGAAPTCDILNVNTSTLVSDTTTFTINNGLQLPHSYGIGLSWTHKQSLTLAADVTQQKWGSVDFAAYDENSKRYALQSGLLSDRTRVSVGADYAADPNHPSNYLKRVHLRLGAAYATPYYKINGHDGPKELALTAGLGLPLLNKWENRSVLNISAQWVHTSAKDLITENAFRINVGLTFNERWFFKWRID